jgi:DNA (cytosine-5)-methyltransferase 1
MSQLSLALLEPSPEVRRLPPQPPLRVAGLFAGVGGIEAGLHDAGHSTSLLCEIDPAASAVLHARFPGVAIYPDVLQLESLPDVDLLTAGFPCQDLSIAGQRAGIAGRRSSLVSQVFRLLDAASPCPKWVLLENVPFMLQLQGGKGMRLLIDELESRGFAWAYRVVDTRAFGLPHRRQRVLVLASKSESPRDVLLSMDAGELTPPRFDGAAVCGFYWTEGHRGVGWSEECVPPLKVGSGLGIPSSPAVWDPEAGTVSTLDIRDVERLQGFDADWTAPALSKGKRGDRWRLVGNSVSVPLGRWVGECLRNPTGYDSRYDRMLGDHAKWPNAAWGESGKRFASSASMWPVSVAMPRLQDFLRHPRTPLSSRAAAGLLKRIATGSTNVPKQFLATLELIAGDEKQRQAGAERQKLEREIVSLRAAARKATQVSAQVELTEKIRLLERRLGEEERSS